MNMAGVVNRVMARDLSYVLGRFHTVRSAYGSLRHTLEAMKPASRDTAHKPSTLFPDADVNGIVRSIRDEAVFIGLNLPPATVEAIKSFALTEPLHAIYAKACLAPVRAALERGQRAVVTFFPAVRVAYVEPEELRRYDPAGRSFLNINTAGDAAEVGRLLR